MQNASAAFLLLKRSGAANGAQANSERAENPFALNKRFWQDFSEWPLIVFSRRNPSKLTTRVQFPSPAPIGFALAHNRCGVRLPVHIFRRRMCYMLRQHRARRRRHSKGTGTLK